jgi:hypothetical protein
MAGEHHHTPARDGAGSSRADGRSIARDRLREAIVAYHRLASDDQVLVENTIIMRPEAFRVTHTALLNAARDFARELRQGQAEPERAVIEVTAVVSEVDLGHDGVHRQVLDAVVRQAVESYYEP